MILAGQAPRALHRPRRDAVGGGQGADRVRAQAAHPRHLLAQRHGLPRHDRRAVAGLHRPQRRLSGQRGRPPRRRGDRHRRPLRRPLGVIVAARLLLELPAFQADPRRRRHRRARPQLSARTLHPGRRAHLPAPAAGRAGAPPAQARRHRGLARRHQEVAGGVGGLHQAQLRHPCHADPARAGGGRLPGGAARRRHPRLRRRRQPQLVHAVLEGAPAPDHAQLVGLLRHGLRRSRRARRQARGARPSRAWRSPATAASPWCRTCCARRSNTTSPWSG